MANQRSNPQELHLSKSNDTNGSLSHYPSTVTVQWADNDPEHPHNLSLKAKWLAVITVSLGSLCV